MKNNVIEFGKFTSKITTGIGAGAFASMITLYLTGQLDDLKIRNYIIIGLFILTMFLISYKLDEEGHRFRELIKNTKKNSKLKKIK